MPTLIYKKIYYTCICKVLHVSHLSFVVKQCWHHAKMCMEMKVGFMLNYKIIVFFITWNKVRICIGIGVSEQSQKKIPVISCCSGDKQFLLKTFFFLNHDLQVDKPNHNLPYLIRLIISYKLIKLIIHVTYKLIRPIIAYMLIRLIITYKLIWLLLGIFF